MRNLLLGYLPPLPGLRVVLSVLSLPQQVREHQRLEGTRARRPWVPERVHHAEVPPVAHGAKRARAKAPRRVQAVDTDHAPETPDAENRGGHPPPPLPSRPPPFKVLSL